MKHIEVAPEVLDRSHKPPAEERRYAEVLATRIAAADRGEFASETEVAHFFLEHGEIRRVLENRFPYRRLDDRRWPG